jgi:hypothetical protein
MAPAFRPIDATFNVPTRADAYKYAAYDAPEHLEARAEARSAGGWQRAVEAEPPKAPPNPPSQKRTASSHRRDGPRQ